MTDNHPQRVPQSPELQPADVREDLHQNMVTHEGVTAEPAEKPSAHLGAVDDQVTLNLPPMHGPANLVGKSDSGDSRDVADDDEIFDPVDEITPG